MPSCWLVVWQSLESSISSCSECSCPQFVAAVTRYGDRDFRMTRSLRDSVELKSEEHRTCRAEGVRGVRKVRRVAHRNWARTCKPGDAAIGSYMSYQAGAKLDPNR